MRKNQAGPAEEEIQMQCWWDSLRPGPHNLPHMMPNHDKPRLFTQACTHCPICGSADYRHPSPGQRECAACGYRDFNNVIVAVAAFILDPDGRLLLIRRGKDPARGLLAPPGGFVDSDESLEQALCREVKEEVGLDIHDLRYLSSASNLYAYRGLTRPVCDVFFTAQTESFAVVLEVAEVHASELVPVDEVRPEDLAFDSMRTALDLLRLSRATAID